MSTTLINQVAPGRPEGAQSGVRYLRPGDEGFEEAGTAWNRLAAINPPSSRWPNTPSMWWRRSGTRRRPGWASA